MDESIASRTKRKISPCQQGENTLGGQIEGYSGPKLPEEIWFHIHSLLPMKDAARVACVSQDFVHSWRYRPNLTFSKETFGSNQNTSQKGNEVRDLTNKVDSILKNHSGIGVKTLKFEFGRVYSKEDFCYLDHLDSWLQIAVKPGIEELVLGLSTVHAVYSFPCSLLSDGTGASLRCLSLLACQFHPTVRSCCLRSLTRLHLYSVYILEDELRCLLSSTPALEWLDVRNCYPVGCLRIPCLQQLSHLGVSFKHKVSLIESKAPNLSSLCFSGELDVRFPLGESPQIKKLRLYCRNAFLHAVTEFPSIMPNLENLSILTEGEDANTPMAPSKFLRLKVLGINNYCGPGYDLFSLVSFLCAAPSLETFILTVHLRSMQYASIFRNPSVLRKMPEQRYDKLKSVHIINFTSAKILFEFTYHILESATSLEHLTLDTTWGSPRCSAEKTSKCSPLMDSEGVVKARRTVLAIQRYMKPKIPSTVELNVLEPCSRCHAA